MNDSSGMAARPRTGMPMERMILAGAALAALVSVGAAIRRDVTAPPPAPPAAAAAPTDAPASDAAVVKAVADLQEHLRKHPDDAKGWRMLGWAYSQTQRLPEAVTAYRRATTIEPGNAEGWSALGEALALSGPGDAMPTDAAAAFRKALAIDAKDARARYFLAVTRDLSGDHRGAIDDLAALLKDSPAGAPWVDNVRQAIARIGQQNGIDVTGTMPPAAAPAGDQAAALAALPPAEREAAIRGMVDTLAARLKAAPGDADGWIRLIQARTVLGDGDAAAQAYRDAMTGLADDAAGRGRVQAAARKLGVPGA